VRATIAECEDLAIEIEDADRASGDLDDLAFARWNLSQGGDHVFRHTVFLPFRPIPRDMAMGRGVLLPIAIATPRPRSPIAVALLLCTSTASSAV